MSKPRNHVLTAERLRELLHYDPLTGVFTRRVTTGGRYGGTAGSAAGSINDQGYVVISVMSYQYRANRLAWLYMTDEWPGGDVDHKDTVRANNAWTNLRDATRLVNVQNKRRAQRNSKTGLLGVCWITRDQTYCSRIKIDGKYVTLGYSKDNPEELHRRYVEAKRQHHAGCTL